MCVCVCALCSSLYKPSCKCQFGGKESNCVILWTLSAHFSASLAQNNMILIMQILCVWFFITCSPSLSCFSYSLLHWILSWPTMPVGVFKAWSLKLVSSFILDGLTNSLTLLVYFSIFYKVHSTDLQPQSSTRALASSSPCIETFLYSHYKTRVSQTGYFLIWWWQWW